MSTILHIAPRFPPGLDGIGDYASRLGAELRSGFGIRSLFLSADPEQAALEDLFVLRKRNAEALQRQLLDISCDQLFLHFSAYGFHKRGIPFWLAKGLSAFLRDARLPLAVFFHEAWASGTLWKSAFYLQPLQRRLVCRLRDLATARFTSTPLMARLIGPQENPPMVLPIPGAVPESVEIPTKRSSGPLRIVVFGQEHTRERSVWSHRYLLRNLSPVLHRLVLAGKNADRTGADYRTAQRHIPENRIEIVSNASREAIQKVLSSADLALSFYPEHLLTKSTTVMTAFACGCPLVLPSNSCGMAPFFSPAPPILTCDGSVEAVENLLRERSRGALDKIARRGFDWYSRHASWKVIVPRLSNVLGASSLDFAVPLDA